MTQPNVPVALQLWSVRDEMRADFSATVAKVADIGYTGVELAGYGNLDAAGANTALREAGLQVVSMHVPMGRVRTEPEAVIGEALLLGSKFVIVPWLSPALYVSRAAAERIGEELDAFGETFRAYGLRFGFHNHNAEFTVHDNKSVFEWMLGASTPRNVVAELDMYWAHVGGYSPAAFLRDHGKRVPLVHVKDSTELGTGPVNYTEVFEAIDSVGAVEWLIVEQEVYNHPPIEAVRMCYEQLKAWGRA